MTRVSTVLPRIGDFMSLLRVLQFLLLFWLFYNVIKVVGNLFRRRASPPEPEKTQDGEEMVQDPHCGTYVPRSLAVKQVIKGQPLYFCSEECRDAYRHSH